MTNNLIRIPKRFDYSFGPQFNSSLATATDQYKEVILDCSDLEYIDSAGIGILVMAHKKSQSKNAKLVITNVNSSAREILGLANLQKLIEIR
jgi:anti-anti-sigma factor